jgi:hypothetical protein
VRVTIARTGEEVTLLKGKRHSPEQIVRKLREADRLLAEGADVDAVCRHLEVSVQTYQRWRSQYRAMRPEDVVRLKALEKENARLKRIVGEQALGYRHAAGGGSGKLLSPERRRRAVTSLRDRFGVSERRACRLTSQHRSSQRYQRRLVPEEALSQHCHRCADRAAARLEADDRWLRTCRRQANEKRCSEDPGVCER